MEPDYDSQGRRSWVSSRYLGREKFRKDEGMTKKKKKKLIGLYVLGS